MKLLIHFQNSMEQPLTFGNVLVISNLNGLNSGSSIIIVISINNSFKWNTCKNQRCSNDNMEQIKTANLFQMTTILKLNVKTKSNNENNIKNGFLLTNYLTNYLTNHTSHGTVVKLLKMQFSTWLPPPYLNCKLEQNEIMKITSKWIFRPEIPYKS